MNFLSRLACMLAAVLLLAGEALATWSIVVVNKKTGEVAVASATCIANKFPLKRYLPVIVVGRGAGAAQSAVDVTGVNRNIIRNGLRNGLSPQEILDILGQSSSHQSRQYGIAAFSGDAVTFTGTGAGDGKAGVTGEIDGLFYAIQGNVITGPEPVLEAEKALRDTPGDLVTRIMAGMEAARAMGGDGRCSCSQSDPDGCGSPPPGTWKSSHCAFIVVSRPGDVDGGCDTIDGCASGTYYLSRQFNGNDTDPDPIFVLQTKVDQWRQNRVGEPDHYLSEVFVDRDTIVADGQSSARVDVVLRDIDGTLLTQGGALLTVTPAKPGTPPAIPGPVTDNGDGTYSFDMVATDQAGRGAWNIVVDFGGTKTVQLYPPLGLETEALTDLHVGRFQASATESPIVPFTVNLGPSEAGRPYWILGSASGTTPGLDLGGVLLPLNRDPFFQLLYLNPGPPLFDGSKGVLDSTGRAEASLDLPPATWSSLVGRRLHFCTLLDSPTGVTSVVDVLVIP